MKRVLVASILGLAASVASSYGQATFAFDTYLPIPGMTVNWLDTGLAVEDSDGVVANIIWQYGTTTGDAGLMVPTATIPGYGPGYIQGPAVALGGNYVSGTAIDFTIQAWVAAQGSFDQAVSKGTLSWTESSGYVVGNPTETFTSLPGTALYLVPEPSTLALAGLGAVALLFRRRQ